MSEINVIGFGVMGKQISALCYLLGYKVTIYNRSEIDYDKLNRQIKILKRSVSFQNLGKVSFANDFSQLGDCITIESVKEDLSVKREVYHDVRKYNSKLYFSNTSSFSPKEIADDVVGLHFFNPIFSIKLIEVNGFYQDDLSGNLINKLKDSGFEIVNVKSNRGYIGNYVLFHEISSVMQLIEKYGYSTEEINSLYGVLYGNRDIFSIIDVIGIDVCWNILNNLHDENDNIYLPKLFDTAISNDVLGKKNQTTIKNIIDIA